MCKSNEVLEVKVVNCWKCDGAKTISAFSHYANGVCFGCMGTGKMTVKVTQEKLEAMGDDLRRKAEWVLNATEEQMEKLTWEQISRCLDFCCHYVMNADARDVYGMSVKEAFEKKGRNRFRQLQQERSDAWFASRN
jgi:uncharacterized protein with HEPN domain